MSMLENESQVIERREDGSKRMYIKEFSPSMAKQAFKDECDLNTILARYKININKMSIQLDASQFKDVSNVTSFHDAIETVRLAEEAFMALPAKQRAEFDNDPIAFVDAFNDPGNREWLTEIGIIQAPREEPAPLAPSEGAPAEPEPEA